MKRYLRMTVLINSVLQVELRDVTVNFDSKMQPVETLVQGFSGVTPGAKVIEVEYKSAVPVAGQEFDVITAVANLDVCQVQIPAGNKTIISEGVFQSGSLSGSVNANTEVAGKFIGTYDAPA